MKLGRDVLGRGDEASDPHGPATPGAHGDVDAKDAGQQGHPRHPGRSTITQLSLEQGWGGRELDVSARDKQRELLGLGRRFLSARHDSRTQPVVGRQDPVVHNRVRPGRRHQRTQPGQEDDGVCEIEYRDSREAHEASVKAAVDAEGFARFDDLLAGPFEVAYVDPAKKTGAA